MGSATLGNNYRHNAVLMWNLYGHEFEDNCTTLAPPHDERFDRGLEPLTKQDCNDLGIESFLLVDGEMTKREARKIEQMRQYEINHLPLGSRLHRKPGACRGLHNDVKKQTWWRVRQLESRFYRPTFSSSIPTFVWWPARTVLVVRI
jgi:hypothetical protein